MNNSELEYSIQAMLEDPDAFNDSTKLRTDLRYYGFDNSCGTVNIFLSKKIIINSTGHYLFL